MLALPNVCIASCFRFIKKAVQVSLHAGHNLQAQSRPRPLVILHKSLMALSKILFALMLTLAISVQAADTHGMQLKEFDGLQQGFTSFEVCCNAYKVADALPDAETESICKSCLYVCVTWHAHLHMRARA